MSVRWHAYSTECMYCSGAWLWWGWRSCRRVPCRPGDAVSSRAGVTATATAMGEACVQLCQALGTPVLAGRHPSQRSSGSTCTLPVSKRCCTCPPHLLPVLGHAPHEFVQHVLGLEAPNRERTRESRSACVCAGRVARGTPGNDSGSWHPAQKTTVRYVTAVCVGSLCMELWGCSRLAPWGRSKTPAAAPAYEHHGRAGQRAMPMQPPGVRPG